jgi:hypothetical protein
MKDVQALPETDMGYGHKLLISKICTRFTKNHKVPKVKIKMRFGEVICTIIKCKIIQKKNLPQQNVK